MTLIGAPLGTAALAASTAYLVVAALAAAAAIVYLALRGASPLTLRTPSVPRRVACLLLRMAFLAGLAVVLLAPSTKVEMPAQASPGAVVLLDDTLSLSIPDGPGRIPRLDEEAAFVEALKEEVLRRGGGLPPVQWYSFAAEASATGGRLTGRGGATDISAAVERAMAGPSGGRPGALVIVSDGADTSGGNPLASARASAARGVKLHTVRLGGASPLVDAAVVSLEAPPRARVHDSVPVRAGVRMTGCVGRKMELVLTAGGREVERRDISAATDAERRTVEFRYVPGSGGPHRLAVGLRQASADAVGANDSRATLMTVLEGPLRLLLYAGALSWDYGALRTACGAAPESVMLDVEAAFLRSGPQRAEARRWELSNVVILTGVSGEELPRSEWESLAERVRSGLGLLVIVDARSARLGALPVGEVLPVRFAAGAEPVPCGSRAVLTAEGATHPAAAIVENPESRASAWRALAPLPTRFPARPVAGAKVLVTDESGEPLVVARDVGEGRTLVVLSPDSHLWCRGERPGEAYAGVVRAFVRSLAGLDAAGDSPARLLPERHSCLPGEKVGLSAHVSASRLPQAGELAVAARLGGVEKAKVALSRSGADWWGELALREPGEYELNLESSGKVVDRSGLIVESVEREIADVRPDHGLLKAMSAASGGLSVDASEPGAAGKVASALARQGAPAAARSVVRPRWSSGWLLALMIAALAAEWWLARR